MTSARDYLLDLQRRSGAAHDGSAYDQYVYARCMETLAKSTPERQALMQQNLERRRAYHARYAARLPTPLQSVQDFARLIDTKAAIDRELERLGQFEPHSNVVLGSVDTASVHARSVYLKDSDEYLVVFSRGLLLLMLLTANAVAVAVTFDPRSVSDRIEDELLAPLAPRYRDVLASVYDGQAPSLEDAIPLFYVPARERRWTATEDGAFAFIVGHEYSHILLGHLAHTDSLDDEWGGWGAEYEADSLAMDLAAQASAAQDDGNPAALALTMQGMCVFFAVVCHLEQYGAEVRGDAGSSWSVRRNHPPTYIRWRRMQDKIRGRVQDWQWPFYRLQMETVERFLRRLYTLGNADNQQQSPARVEWHFQRACWETMAGHRLVPQHLFIALRCTQAALQGGAPLDSAGFQGAAARADDDLQAAGARPLRSYADPLPAIAEEMSSRALADARVVTPPVMSEIVARLTEVVLLDARTRFGS